MQAVFRFPEDFVAVIDIEVDDLPNVDGIRLRQSARDDPASGRPSDDMEGVLRFDVAQQGLDHHRRDNAANAATIDGQNLLSAPSWCASSRDWVRVVIVLKTAEVSGLNAVPWVKKQT
jgi:hypothetical protein